MWALPKPLREYFTELTQTTIEHREKYNVTRNDLMQLMIEVKHDLQANWSNEKIGGNLFVFFAAGVDTSTSVITYCLLELARNKNVYNKARKDVLDTFKKHNNTFSYDSVQSMKYLDQCINGSFNIKIKIRN